MPRFLARTQTVVESYQDLLNAWGLKYVGHLRGSYFASERALIYVSIYIYIYTSAEDS
jgi:hypothetical protein